MGPPESETTANAANDSGPNGSGPNDSGPNDSGPRDSQDRESSRLLGVKSKDLALLWGLCLLTLGTWLLPLAKGPGFSYDDREAIVGNPVVEGHLPLGRAFTQDYWHHYEDAGHYRPMATVLLAMDRARSEEPEPRLFRITNVYLHVAILLMLGLGVLRLSSRWRVPAPWFGLAVFALHPISADVVAWISGRTSLVSGFGAALGLLTMSFLRRGKTLHGGLAFLGTTAGAGLALLGKEDGLTLAAVLPALAWGLGGWRAGAGSALGAALAVGSIAVLRAQALGSAIPSSPAPILEGLGLMDRLDMGAGAWGHGLLQLAAPWAAAPPSLEPSDIKAWHSVLWIAAVGLAATWLLRKVHGDRDPGRRSASLTPLLSLAAVLVAVLPLIQIVPAGELFAPRFMYQPLLLGTFLVSWIGRGLLAPLGKWSIPAHCASVLGLMALSATGGSARYQDRLSYWESHLPAHRDSAKVWTAIGQARQEAGDITAARAAYLRSIELDDGYGAPWAKLGELELRENDPVQAEAYLRRAIAEDPSAVTARANLARAVLSAGDPEEAARIYGEAIQRAPGRAALYRGLARTLLAANRLEEAEAEAQKAMALSPRDRLTVRLLATIQRRARGSQPGPSDAPK